MSNNKLSEIIDLKKTQIEVLKKKISVEELNTKISNFNNYLDFKEKIKKNIKENKLSLIAEIKKASPSAGVIVEDYQPKNIAKIYSNNNASCLSVLTEEKFFLGKLADISEIKQEVSLPVLCKDFFIDPFQIKLSKSFGADAILLILAGLNDDLALKLYNEAITNNMSVIVEVHDAHEAERAKNFKEAMIGINNRNLKSLKTDINTTYDLFDILKDHGEPLISESGIKNDKDILNIKNKTNIKSFLIGESLLKSMESNPIFDCFA
tara:strand:+ start:1934 stop:2728 length:795 start_codon:yes stop_codon:yes gene_type:complete